MADDHSIDSGKSEESEEVPKADDQASAIQDSASSMNIEDVPENPTEEPDFSIFTQDELDDQIRIQKEIEKSSPRSAFKEQELSESDSKPVEIEKEAIKDPQLLDRLMEEVLESNESSSTTRNNLLTQDDIDVMLSAQLEKKPDGPGEIDEEKLDDYLNFPRPPILKEPIESAELHDQLMQDRSQSINAEEETSPALASQNEVDAVIKEEMLMAQAADAIMKDETDSTPVESSDDSEDFGLLGQDEIDQLLEIQSKSDAKPSRNVFSKPIDKNVWPEGYDPIEADQGLLDQDEIDKLLNTDSVSEAVEEDEGTLDQSDIDALLAANSEGTTAEPEEAVAEDEGTLDQSDIDALLAANREGAPEELEEAVAEEEGTLDQSDIDALLAEHSGSTGDAPEETVAEDEGTLDQSDIDALLAEHSGSTGEAPEEAVGEEEGTLDQSDIDALLAANSEGAPEELEEAVAEEEGTLDQSDTNAELAQMAEGDPDSLLIDGDSEEALIDQDMDDRLDGKDDEELAIVVDDQLDEVTEPADSDIEPAVNEADEITAEAAPEEVATVAAENAAAGALVSQSVELSGGESESTVPEEEEVRIAGDEMMDERRPESGKLLSFPNFSSVMEGQGTRLITGIAAGLIVTISSFSYLMTHRLQSYGTLQSGVINQSDTLKRALALSRELMEDGNYEGAYQRLSEGIGSSPQSVYRVDADYLLLEAEYRLQPDKLDVDQANIMHSRIDSVIENSPMHPDKTRALFIKGKIYEKQGNMLAARLEYRNILTNDPTSSQSDEVLFALGGLELNTDRPRQAANYLQQLRRNHPASLKAGDAHILLGDAYKELGDVEQARKMYIEVAEDHINDQTGDLAILRLGNLDYESGDFDNAIRELENRISNGTTVEGNDGAMLLLAKIYRVKKRYEDARNTLNGLIDFFPESPVTPSAYIELAKVLKDLGYEREGVRTATQTVQRYPNNPEVLEETGHLLADFGKPGDAARTWVAAHEAGAENPDILLRAGRLYAEVEQYDDAKNALQFLIRDFPRSSQSTMGGIEIAKVNFAQGHLTQAAEQLESLALLSTNQAQKMAILQATSDLYAELGLWERVAAAQGAITAMTDEPEQLAKSAMALYQADHLEEGLALENRIDLAKLTPDTKYKYMNAHGNALTRVNPDRALEWLENAHTTQPDARTPRGIQRLLDVNLSMGKSARARALVSELAQEAMSSNDPMKIIQAQQAATSWGDFLFEREDYRAAVDAYGMALKPDNETMEGVTPFADPVTDDQNWSMYQRANALFKLGNYRESLILYEQVALTKSPWANESSIKAASARLEQRMKDDSDTVADETD